MISNLKHSVFQNVKNFIGWRTNRKIIVISVDDYGNVRLASKSARAHMEKEGLKVTSPFEGFDMFDSLENRLDLEMLFEVLTSVKDHTGNHAIFTPFTVPCNINFKKIRESGYSDYYYELLPETYLKLSNQQAEAYEGTWNLWQEGIKAGIFMPQFHGREHVNLKLFNEKIAKKDRELITALNNRSFARISSDGYKTISLSAAFDFWDFEENKRFKEIIEDGLNTFEKVFGYRAVHFNPPGGREHPFIHKVLHQNGIKYLDTPMLKNEHQGKGEYKRVFNYTGKTNKWGQTYLVRNVVFEPTQDRGVDWIAYALKQIEAAFRWHRPAIISSHRVNFCGHIDKKNRQIGINALKELLKKIVQRWPDVEFMAANELGDIISDGKK